MGEGQIEFSGIAAGRLRSGLKRALAITSIFLGGRRSRELERRQHGVDR